MFRPFVINLQHHAEPGVEGAADQGNDAQNNDATPQGGEQTKDKDPEKAFAARLGHEKKKITAEFAPFKTVIERQAKAAGMEVGDYLKYVQEQQDKEELETEAERTGKTPEQIKAEKEKADAEARLAKFERKEKLTAEEKELVSDPKIGKFVSDNLAKIREIAEAADTDLKTGMLIVAGEMLPELLEKADPEKQRETIIKDYLESLKKGGKPIEIGGGATAVGNSGPKTFEDARKAAIETLRAANKT